MLRVRLQQFEVLPRRHLNAVREHSEGPPELRGSPNASKRRGPARTMMRRRFVAEFVELAGINVGFKLPVPQFASKFGEPRRERLYFPGGKRGNRLFDFFERSHWIKVAKGGR
ncbi:MAG: hypothetical protein ABL957_03680 [Parvularculaceae bacterium]